MFKRIMKETATYVTTLDESKEAIQVKTQLSDEVDQNQPDQSSPKETIPPVKMPAVMRAPPKA
jgi:hypothetical protein